MPVEIAKSDRAELKTYFVRNAIPTEANFAALIDAMVNQRDDGLAKSGTTALSIQASGDATKKVLNLYGSFADADPAWTVSLNSGRPGLGISGGAQSKAPRLFIDAATGNLGVGTVDPKFPLDVTGMVRIGGGTNSILFSDKWQNFAGAGNAEISNDVSTYKTLMIVGNSTGGLGRRVSVWDRLEINGDLYVSGNTGLGTAAPQDKLDVAGNVRVLSNSNPILFSDRWRSFPDAVKNHAEISNDTGTYKTLMIVGNQSGGMGRRVSIWDRLEVNGTLQVAFQENWQGVAWQNGWGRYHTSWPDVAFFKDSLGFVHLRGLMAHGAVGADAFTLPPGYRPRDTKLFACQCAPNAIGRVDVYTSGAVRPVSGDNRWFALDGLHFPTTV